MKIAFVTYTLAKKRGGITTSVVNLLGALRNIAEVDVFSIYEDQEFDDIDPQFRNASNVYLARTTDPYWCYSPQLRKLLEDNIHRYDIIHVHGLWLYHNYLVYRLARKHGIPYIITPHGMLEDNAFANKAFKKRIYWSLLMKRMMYAAKAIHCLSPKEYKRITEKFCPDAPAFLIPNGIRIESLEKNPGDTIKIGFFARLSHLKGPDRLIQAFGLIEGRENLELWLGGSGTPEYEAYIEGLIEQSPARDRIKKLGFLQKDQIRQFFSQISFLAVPSFIEGLSMSILEALSFATPMMITPECNLDEIEQYDAGILIPDNEIGSIRNGILAMLDRDLNAMSQNAFRMARENYDIDVIARKLLDEYKKIVPVKA